MLASQITTAFRTLLNPNVDYHVDVTEVSQPNRAITVTITLRAGKRFCCGELGCHFYPARGHFERLRQRLKEAKQDIGCPMTIRVHWVVESGSLLETNLKLGLIEEQEEGFIVDEVFTEPSGAESSRSHV